MKHFVKFCVLDVERMKLSSRLSNASRLSAAQKPLSPGNYGVGRETCKYDDPKKRDYTYHHINW